MCLTFYLVWLRVSTWNKRIWWWPNHNTAWNCRRNEQEAGHVIWCLYWSNMKIGSEVWRGGVWKFGFSIDYSILTLYVFSLMCICMLKFFHLSFMFLFKVIWMSFCRSLLVYCKDGLTCHHYDSMNQGNIEAAKRVWNFLRISTKGDYLVFQLYDSIINNIQYSTVQYNTVQYNTVLFPLNVAMG